MPEEYKTTSVRILGEDYPLKSDADTEYLRNLAEFVESKIAGIASRTKLPPRLRREVLAALLIADDYFSEKKKNEELKKRVEELTGQVKSALETDFTVG